MTMRAATLGLLFAFTSSAWAASPAPFLRLKGEAEGDFFGISVAAAGDYNGDGYGDVIVGAHLNEAAGDQAGRAYIYFGGPSPDAIPDIILSPPGANAFFGFSVDSAGDFNGDGFGDVIVGANGGVPPFHSGRGYVYFGGPAADSIADMVLSAGYFSDGFGISIALAGDVNGDGFADVIVGAPRGGPSGPVGAAYVFFGGPGADTAPDVTFIGNGSAFGASVSPAGDVNGDAFADVIVGSDGRAFVYYGGAVVDTSPDLTLIGNGEGDRFGLEIASAGDVNGDRFGDMLVGASFDASRGLLTGRAYVYYGGPSPEPTPSLTLTGAAAFDLFGAGVSSAGDVSGDGRTDLIIGAPQTSIGGAGAGAGRAHIYFGGADIDSVADMTLSGDPAGWYFGSSIAMGDMNGDRVPDAIVGEPGLDKGEGVVGSVYLYDVALPLVARAFLPGKAHRPVVLAATRSLCIQVEPVNQSFTNAKVDVASLRLVSPETGSVDEIRTKTRRPHGAGDTDGNGVSELAACFDGTDLKQLFSSIRGLQVVEAAVEGRLIGGQRLRGPISLAIVGAGRRKGRDCSVHPNPFNPEATLSFETMSPGRVTVRLFDLNGRCVRSLVVTEFFDAGTHDLNINNQDDHGTPLASGVYFFRVEGPDGALDGRFVIAR